MSHFDSNVFLAHLPQLQHTPDEAACWSQIELGIREFARQNRNEKSHDSMPFQQWWETAFDLLSSRQIQISNVNFAPSELGDQEFIELVNTGPAIIDLSGWRINAGADTQNFIFPAETLIHPGKTVRVFTHHEGEFNFATEQQIWNNKGDTALLYNTQDVLVGSWCYRAKAHDAICITHINFDGKVSKTEADEYVEMTNTSSHWLDISGWTLTTHHSAEFVFPNTSVVAPHQRIRVYTNQIHPESGGYSFGSHKAIWNNNGGTATLSDDREHQVSSLSY